MVDGVGENVHGVHGAAAPLYGVDVRLGDGEGDHIARHRGDDAFGEGAHHHVTKLRLVGHGDFHGHRRTLKVEGGYRCFGQRGLVVVRPGVGVVHGGVVYEQLVAVHLHGGDGGGGDRLGAFVENEVSPVGLGGEQVGGECQHAQDDADHRGHG